MVYFGFISLSLFANGPNENDLKPPLLEKEHIYQCEGGSFSYHSVAGIFPVADKEDKQLAGLSFLAYFMDNASDRPITFVFPGGPGGSCAAEILTIGPRRLQTSAEGKTLLPPYKLIDNPESLLPWTDLVFVDPVNTGYSRFAEEAEEIEMRYCQSLEGDIAILSQFVQNFVSLFQKWNNPKYLFGISYGAVRCCGIAKHLLPQFSFHGLILLSPAIDFSTLCGQRNLPLPDALLIPTFAATAWHHGRLWPESSLEEVVDLAKRFAYEEYLPFMLRPPKLNAKEQNHFHEKLSQLIGLPLETVRRYCGRFDEELFTSEFMASERKVIGGLDTRYIGDLSSIVRHHHCEDPSYQDMQGLECAFNAYVQQELDVFHPFQHYVFYCHKEWNFSSYDSIHLPDLFQRIRRTLVANPRMQIFLGCGYYDCRTPFAATEYCFDHLELPLTYQDNFQLNYYTAGHGFVFDLSSLKKLQKDLISFYTRN